MYRTKGKELLVCGDNPFKERKEYFVSKNNIALNGNELPILNGKVVFKFRCYKGEEIYQDYQIELGSWRYYENEEVIEELACLGNGDLQDYLDMKEGYAIHISDLVIFDKPKELSEFDHYLYVRNHNNKKIYYLHSLTKAPQSFMYIESEE